MNLNFNTDAFDESVIFSAFDVEFADDEFGDIERAADDLDADDE